MAQDYTTDGEDIPEGKMTISVCMIVRDEEESLPACLGSLRGIYDELIVVDTGSVDRTREIARSLGARLYDLPWTEDFAAARNYAFSLASGDYIYSADADERLEEEEREKLLALKRDLAAGRREADIVQFLYAGQLSQDSVYNYDMEYRPKLFRRLRPFVWEGAVHEQVRLETLVYDSDIVIRHAPRGQHAERDLRIFARMRGDAAPMPARLLKLYARELYMAGTQEDLAGAWPYFAARAEEEPDADAVEAALLVVLRAARQEGRSGAFFKYAIRLLDGGWKSSELCLELGEQYLAEGDAAEALIWFLSAREAEPSLDIRAAAAPAADGAARCLRLLGDTAEAERYENIAKEL